MKNFTVLYKNNENETEEKIIVIAENETQAKERFNEYIEVHKLNFDIISIVEFEEYTKKDLKKMKKNDLVDLFIHMQNLESNKNILSIVNEIREEIEESNEDYNNLEMQLGTLEEENALINDTDLFYSLKNNLDDLINNVSRETIERTVNELKFDLENLEKFYLTLKGVNHSN